MELYHEILFTNEIKLSFFSWTFFNHHLVELAEPTLTNHIQKKHQDVGYPLDLRIPHNIVSFEILSFLVSVSEVFSSCLNAKRFLLNTVFSNSEQNSK